MEHSLLVSRGQTGAQLARDGGGGVGGEPPFPLQQRGEVLTRDVFHGEEVPPIRFFHIVNAAHVGVGDLSRIAHFAEEPGEGLGVASQLNGKEFQRHLLIEPEVFGPVDLPHASPAEQIQDPVAPRDDRSRTNVVGRGGRCDACSSRVGPGRHRLDCPGALQCRQAAGGTGSAIRKLDAASSTNHEIRSLRRSPQAAPGKLIRENDG